MTYINSWEEFEEVAERLYLQDPIKTRYTMKYCHKKGVLCLKLTDNRTILPKLVWQWLFLRRTPMSTPVPSSSNIVTPTYNSPLDSFAFPLLCFPPLRFRVHQFVSEKIPTQRVNVRRIITSIMTREKYFIDSRPIVISHFGLVTQQYYPTRCQAQKIFHAILALWIKRFSSIINRLSVIYMIFFLIRKTYQNGMQIDPVHFEPFHLVKIIQLRRGRYTHQDILQQFVLVEKYHLAVKKTRPTASGWPKSRTEPLYHHLFPRQPSFPL
ncbi:Signal recognition particle 9 kDa protein [Dufourea novaeangliae]|uniref:Signal recognition particle 9 kDa protein n=1 Tax=Dufourea novaeangliae TaxID=178035 RepID=A0A154PDN6_DUFNO|nr:Signal recognition particle 9 kDa protein [Dufourea novaeangliae]